ncbi:hypothetical protein [Paenibacillus sp. PL2-23]|uniref:hypothetical protein n=1 Tax=Paenibacillus sp. PL2-23 TaxID=2100729 RepID=UPI0030FA8C30
MLSERSRKLLKMLWHLYHGEAVTLHYGRLGRVIGLSEKQIIAALAELVEKRRIAIKEGRLQVLAPREDLELQLTFR